jgi:hypothetical protein
MLNIAGEMSDDCGMWISDCGMWMPDYRIAIYVIR